VPRENLDGVVAHFAPALTAAVTRQILGDAKRSDLEFFARLMNGLLHRHPTLKSGLQNAFTADIASPADRQARLVALQQLGSTTNVNKIRRLLQETWFRSREMVDYSAVKSS
jgi:hypothetical protein